MCKNYNEFKKILEDYNEKIVNETDPIKKQELVTYKMAFLWENKIMFKVYKAVQNVTEEDFKNLASNLTDEDLKDILDKSVDDFKEDSMYTFCKDCQYYEPYNDRFGLCKRLSVFSYHEDYCPTDYIVSKKDKGLIEKIDKLFNE